MKPSYSRLESATFRVNKSVDAVFDLLSLACLGRILRRSVSTSKWEDDPMHAHKASSQQEDGEEDEC